MDSFDNFQYDSNSSYGGMGIVDDTSSIYTANTRDDSSLDLTSLSLSEHDGAEHASKHRVNGSDAATRLDEDFDSVLDDLKEEDSVELPPHACR